MPAAESELRLRQWQQLWPTIDLTDLYGYPLWERGVHDLLRQHYERLELIFWQYCKIDGAATLKQAVSLGSKGWPRAPKQLPN